VWRARLAVKPGISGLWQVSGRSELTLSEMVELDLDYVKRRSLWLNVWILLRTVPAVLSLRGAS
jgi:lipopolysaccharide/colanic/teichoic acid biosynthesis glycosyltransferase